MCVYVWVWVFLCGWGSLIVNTTRPSCQTMVSYVYRRSLQSYGVQTQPSPISKHRSILLPSLIGPINIDPTSTPANRERRCRLIRLLCVSFYLFLPLSGTGVVIETETAESCEPSRAQHGDESTRSNLSSFREAESDHKYNWILRQGLCVCVCVCLCVTLLEP